MPDKDTIYMQRCFELAQRAKGYTAPNPMVGAVLVYNDRIIGEGWHQNYGGAHAEVNCFQNVADADKHLVPDCTMYVNLEPCAHYGLTPPCALRIVKEQVSKVVIANVDPFEKVGGKGIDILLQNGVAVEKGLLEQKGKWLNRRFFCFHEKLSPYVILKWAQTADGFFAPKDGSRLQITGEQSMQLVHKWRTEESAIMIGRKTALADDPRLTARKWNGRQPLRIVFDRNNTLPRTLNIFNGDAATWLISERNENFEGNVHTIPMTFDESLPEKILRKLYEHHILSLIIEGGTILLKSFIDAGLWDEARIFTGTPKLSEGLSAPMLKDERYAFRTMIGEDTLDVYTNQKSPFSYIEGMEL